jgi:hypothetical protein
MSFTEFQHLLPDNKLPKELVQRGIQLILISLAFLHDNGVIHTGKVSAQTSISQPMCVENVMTD